MFRNITMETWGDQSVRSNMYVPLPTGIDGVSHSVQVFGTNTEGRFLAFVLAGLTADQVKAGLEYAASDLR
jgi:hypothetical protein